jgi:hypothetical protein
VVPFHNVGGNLNLKVTMENIMEVPPKTKNRTTILFSSPTPE